ncbi:hypothetical protein [Niastella populi]|uniref:hypothetical protein n=1 Tax=Niastella populi TaxID=550983 RepID=UPI001F620B74|nr:hypothetical protein [Niastella populi]
MLNIEVEAMEDEKGIIEKKIRLYFVFAFGFRLEAVFYICLQLEACSAQIVCRFIHKSRNEKTYYHITMLPERFLPFSAGKKVSGNDGVRKKCAVFRYFAG